MSSDRPWCARQIASPDSIGSRPGGDQPGPLGDDVPGRGRQAVGDVVDEDQDLEPVGGAHQRAGRSIGGEDEGRRQRQRGDGSSGRASASHDRARDGGAEAGVAALAEAAQAERVRLRAHLLVEAVHRRDVGRVGQRVVHQGAGEQLAVGVVDEASCSVLPMPNATPPTSCPSRARD